MLDRLAINEDPIEGDPQLLQHLLGERPTKKRDGIRPPKFASQFARIDFDAMPLPVLSLFPFPEPVELERLSLLVTGLDSQPRSIPWPDLSELPRVSLWTPIICSIFNWAEVVEWGGVRLCDFLDFAGLDVPEDAYVAFYSRDGHFFETLTGAMARDPRVLLTTALHEQPLPEEYGGPLRLVVPFLQGYKSVKWLGGIRVFRNDPMGIKRLLGQSKTGRLGRAWKDSYGIIEPDEGETTPI